MKTIGGTSGDTLRLYCNECEDYRPCQNDLSYTGSMGFCFALSVLSCGLFLPVWLYLAFKLPPNRYQCKVCGGYANR